MKEDVMDILMYLFENYIDDGIENMSMDGSIHKELSRAGFSSSSISKALDWLKTLASLKEKNAWSECQQQPTQRIFSGVECERLDIKARGFIIYLENKGVLDYKLREMVIEQALALEARSIDLEQMQWVVLMVLFNIPGSEAAFTWIQDVVFEQQPLTH